MRSRFWIICCLFVFTFAAALLTTGCATTPSGDSGSSAASERAAADEDDAKKVIAARVNGANLYMDALVAMMNRLPPAQGEGREALEEHKKSALDKLVLQELAYQQAKAQGLSIPPEKIDMALDNFRENSGGEQGYQEYLVKEGIKESDLRDRVERSLLIELVYAREVLDKVSIPEEQVREEYEKVKHLYVLPAKASVIDVFLVENKGKASEKKAKALLSKIKAHPEKDPWSLVLDGSFVIRNLNAGKDREKELFSAAAKLKPQELSGVIKTSTGLHIVKLKEYSPEKQLTFEEVRSKLELKFKVPAQEKRTQEWEKELKQNAKIEILSEAAPELSKS